MLASHRRAKTNAVPSQKRLTAPIGKRLPLFEKEEHIPFERDRLGISKPPNGVNLN